MSLQVSEAISKQYCLPFSGTNAWKENICPLNEHPSIYGLKLRLTVATAFLSTMSSRKVSEESFGSNTKAPWFIWYHVPLAKPIVNRWYFVPSRKLEVIFWLYRSLYRPTNCSLRDCALRSTIRLDQNLMVAAIKIPITKSTIVISMRVNAFFIYTDK